MKLLGFMILAMLLLWSIMYLDSNSIIPTIVSQLLICAIIVSIGLKMGSIINREDSI